MNSEDLNVATKMLELDSLFPENSVSSLNTALSPDELHRKIAERVGQLLSEDFSKLMASLYQIDVAEELVAEAFRQPNPAAISNHLATLIIAREVHKAQTRGQRRFS